MSRGAAPRAARYRKAFAIIFLDFNMLGQAQYRQRPRVELVGFAAAHGSRLLIDTARIVSIERHFPTHFPPVRRQDEGDGFVKVGFIGLGSIGIFMARRLARCGFNRSRLHQLLLQALDGARRRRDEC